MEYKIRMVYCRPGDIEDACGNCMHLLTRRKDGIMNHSCGLDGHDIGYVAFFEEKCKHWKKI